MLAVGSLQMSKEAGRIETVDNMSDILPINTSRKRRVLTTSLIDF